jgi:hypothetical protein
VSKQTIDDEEDHLLEHRASLAFLIKDTDAVIKKLENAGKGRAASILKPELEGYEADWYQTNKRLREINEGRKQTNE